MSALKQKYIKNISSPKKIKLVSNAFQFHWSDPDINLMQKSFQPYKQEQKWQEQTLE